MAFRIASSPYTHNRRSTSTIMLLVLLAALPGIAAQLYFFGWGNLIQVLIAAVAGVAAEAAILKMRKLPLSKTLGDNSALLTALLLGISIPRWHPGG